MARQLPPEVEETESLAQQVAASTSRRVLPPEPVRRERGAVPTEGLLSSGLTLVNLACTDNHEGAWMLGGISTMPGESSAGKTVLALTSLAEATHNPRFNNYTLIHDDAEERRAFDMNYLFGQKVADRIMCPPLGNSKTIQSFEANCLHLVKSGKPFIEVLDSLDSLSCDEELEKEMKRAMALAKSKEAADKIAGSYGMEKAKIVGQTLRMINNSIKNTGSLVLILQQLRQNIGGGMFEPEYITSGGEAPYFYSNHQLWLTRGAQHKEKDLVVGRHAKAITEKNSATGKRRVVEFDYFYDLGVDDIGSCVDFMINEGFWRERQMNNVKGIYAGELDLFEGKRNDLIKAIERENLESELRKAVGGAWQKREDAASEKIRGRKPRYA